MSRGSVVLICFAIIGLGLSGCNSKDPLGQYKPSGSTGPQPSPAFRGVSVNFPTLNFLDVSIGETRELPIVLTNSGDSVSGVNFDLGDYWGDFNWQTDNCNELASGTSCSMILTFTPSVLDQQSQELHFVFLDQDSVERRIPITLVGNGIRPRIVLAEGSLDFGHVTYTGTAVQRSIDVTNEGYSRVESTTLTGISLPYAVQSNGCAGGIEIGATCTIQFSYDPSSGTAHNQYVEINYLGFTYGLWLDGTTGP